MAINVNMKAAINKVNVKTVDSSLCFSIFILQSVPLDNLIPQFNCIPIMAVNIAAHAL